MISESIIALIWAAIAMAFFYDYNGATNGVAGLNAALAEHNNDASWVVNTITNTTLGKIGALLALLGVVAAPISTGDTAFRSARLIIADIIKLDQKSIVKRLYICIPMFVIGFIITLINYEVLWRYFSWANQTLSVFTLWAITVYLYKKPRTLQKQNLQEAPQKGAKVKGRCNYLISLFPALFMTFICTLFLFSSNQMVGLQMMSGSLISLGIIILTLVAVMLHAKALSTKETKV
ncbi:MAG: hypothetical protein IKI67_01710, partial [Bacteroidales bacterium]|nr:hypothetical protein [Bacteroidales bacterium]